ncbi:MAG: hypothetical protein O3A00_26005, partial [Planctomycetota bacterium]|nr:hypothetical protein [Planctomycetota bacterium]
YGRLGNASGTPNGAVCLIERTEDDLLSTPAVSVGGNGNYVVTWTAASRQATNVYAVILDSSGNPVPTGRNQYVAGEVRGMLFLDLNGNGIQDVGEGPANGVSVLLDANGNGVADGGEQSVTTLADGSYRFTGVAVGVYDVIPPAGVAGARSLVDTFTRVDSTDVGADWTELRGDLRVEGNQLRAAANTTSMMVHNNFTATDQSVEFDLDYNASAGSRTVYGIVYLAYAGADDFLEVQIRDNARDGNFDLIAFNRTSGSDTWPRMTGGSSHEFGAEHEAVTPFTSAHVRVVYDSVSRTVTIGLDTDSDGDYDQVVTRGGVVATDLGTRIAIGGYNDPVIDNVSADGIVGVIPPSNTLSGEEFAVDASLDFRQYTPSIDANASGAFVVGYASSDGSDVYFKTFSAAGAELIGPVRANSYTTGDQERPSVGLKDNGEVIAVWSSDGQEGSNREIYSRQFFPGGQAATPEIRVNAYTADDQKYPDMSLNDGRAGVVWVSDDQDDTVESIYGRFLDFPTATPRPFVRVTESQGTANDNIIAFSSTTHGSAAPTAVVRLWNTGTATLTGTASITGNGATGYSFDGSGSISLAAGGFRDFTITLATGNRGSFEAVFSMTHNAGGSPAVVSLSGAIVPNTDAYENNNTRALAVDLAMITTSRLVSALTLHDGTDEDWFQFQVPGTGRVSVGVDHTHAEGDLNFVVLDRNDGLGGAATSISDNESAGINVVANQTYYVQVFSQGDAANAYSLTIARINQPVSVTLSNTVTLIMENSDTSTRVKVADVVVADDGLGTNSLTLAGTHAAMFELDAGVLYLKQNTVLDTESLARLDVRVDVDDSSLVGDPDDSVSLSIDVGNVREFVIVESSSSTAVGEDLSTDSFTVVLDTQPTSDVVFNVSSGDMGEATVSPVQLTFTPADWDAPQVVTLTGVNDFVIDGEQTSLVTVSVVDAASDDDFDDMPDQTVNVTTADDDVAGFMTTLSDGTTTVIESGTSDTFDVVLDVQPDSDVVLSVSSGDTGEATVSPATLTFTSANWNVAQTVTITGEDDDIIDGEQTTVVTVAVVVAASDDKFDAVATQDVSVTTADDDVAGFTITESGGTSVIESGTSDTFDVVLDVQPDSDVVLSVSSGDTGEATVSPATLTFTSANWNVAQTVAVTGEDDDIIDGEQTTVVTVAVVV